jgi:hypothetical protein
VAIVAGLVLVDGGEKDSGAAEDGTFKSLRAPRCVLPAAAKAGPYVLPIAAATS